MSDVCSSDLILRSYKHRDFPWIEARRGQPIPDGSRFHSHRGDKLSPLMPTSAEGWIATEYGQRAPFMREQSLPMGNGVAVLRLWMEAEEIERARCRERGGESR